MMGMLVTGTSSDILKLSTDDFTLYISGSSENKKFKAIPLNYDYTNSNYHTKKDGITKEVLVVNY